MAITTTLSATDRVAKALNVIAGVLRDAQPALEVVASSIKTNIKLGFRTGTAPDGARWRPLRHRSGQPLKDTGVLANSITHRTTKTEAEIGTNVCYGIVHQFGATVEAGKPPHKTLCGLMTKGSPYLRFKGQGGKDIFAKKVVIPPRPFMPQDTLPDDWADDAMVRLAKAVGDKL
jgi:phage virion morphogenesis protein